MIKFKITPERFAESCSILEYLGTTAKNPETIIRVAPRFILDEKSEYVVVVNLDEDGDIKDFEHVGEALIMMSKVTPKRLEKLIEEFSEAAKAIVNPTKDVDLHKPTSMATEKPPDG